MVGAALTQNTAWINVKRAIANWNANLTYIWTDKGWLYLAVVLDLFNREIVGWSIKSQPPAHHRQPLGVPPTVVAVDVVVVVFPVPCVGVVGRIDVDAVHLPGEHQMP